MTEKPKARLRPLKTEDIEALWAYVLTGGR